MNNIKKTLIGLSAILGIAGQKAEAGNITVYINGTLNSEQELNDEHKELFVGSKDIPAFGLGFGIEAALNKFGMEIGIGGNYNLSKKVESINANDEKVGTVERQDMQGYGLLRKAVYKKDNLGIGGVIKPGLSINKRTQTINQEKIIETVNNFSLPIGAYFEIGKTIKAQIESLYDPLKKEMRINIGGKYSF